MARTEQVRRRQASIFQGRQPIGRDLQIASAQSVRYLKIEQVNAEPMVIKPFHPQPGVCVSLHISES